MIDLEKYLTPYKLGRPVLTGSGIPGSFDYKAVDVPFVFVHNNKYHMLYTGFDGIGYQSALAVSDDLINWSHKGVILKRDKNNKWDSIGACATWMIKESNNLYDTPRLTRVHGRYWLVYHSYPSDGYENGPAEIGLAWTEDENLLNWHKLDQPVFSWRDGDDWEAGGLYKACIIRNNDLWYMFYNAKNRADRWTEQTGVATSSDLLTWERAKTNPVLKVTPGSWDERFVSDPYVVSDGKIWLNFYFGLGSGHAQEGLAYSRNLTDWHKLPMPIITSGLPGSLDERHAHKASIFYENDVLYHFYCAARVYREGDVTRFNDEFRSITVAASKPWKEKSL
jgi:predicted GH43/DUF377 family glycosyl hydrolase